MKAAEAVLITPVRVALGGLFVFAASMKLSNPQAFAESVKAFKVFDLETASHLVVLATFTVPWMEMICGVLLILGLFTRPAAFALSVLVCAFTVAILSVLARHLDVSCGCFGKYEWPCRGNVGLCHVGRNSILLLASLLIAWRGGGPASFDRLRVRRGMDSEAGEA